MENTDSVDITVNRISGTMGVVHTTAVVIEVTATETEDYILPNDIIQFIDGQASAVISITIINDGTVEDNEVEFLMCLYIQNQTILCTYTLSKW